MMLRRMAVASLSAAIALGATQSIAGGQPLTFKQLADVSDCEAAISEYNTAVEDLSTALSAYTTCISDSQGHDDCSTEFSSVQSAQSDFETAVSSYQSDCG